MRYEENPFNILHVSMRDSHDKILDKVEELSLTLDEALCSQASSMLTNPTRRIEAEVSWFPGYTRKKIKEAFERAKSEPDEFIDELSEKEKTYADVNAELLAFLNIPYPKMLKDYLLKFVSDWENIDEDTLFVELNKERNIAKIPAIPSVDVLTAALQNRQKELSEIIYSFLKSFGQDTLIGILTSSIEETTEYGEFESESIILRLIEKYEVDIQPSLKDAEGKVKQQISLIESGAAKGIHIDELNSAIDTFDLLLKAWDRLAQPIQVSMLSQGLEHSASKDMAYSVRQLALNLYNEHNLLDAAKRITELMKTVFAEILTVAEKTEEDKTILNRISKRDEIFNKAFSNCDRAFNDVKSNPRSGFSVAEKLLFELEGMLKATCKNPINVDTYEVTAVTAISDIYINAMLACIIEYGNATKEWEKCYDFVGKVSNYATDPKTIKRIASNRYILSQNMKAASSNSHGINLFGWLGLMIAIVLLCILMRSCSGPSTPSSSSGNTNPQQTTQRQPTVKNPIPRKNVVTGYEDSHPYLNDEGLCEITIDNTKNNMPVYVRVWDAQKQIPVRAFFIKQGGSFTTTELTPGKYEIRYRELYEDDIPPYGSKSEVFSLTQRRTSKGTEYDTITMTLYKVQNGNTQTERINANDI